MKKIKNISSKMTDEVFTICISNTSKENLIRMLIEYEIIEYESDDQFTMLPDYKIIYCGNLSGKTHDSIPLAEFLLKMKRMYPENLVLVAGKGDIFRLGIESDLSKSISDDEKSSMNLELFDLFRILDGTAKITEDKPEPRVKEILQGIDGEDVIDDFIDNFDFRSTDNRFEHLEKIMEKIYGCKNAVSNRAKYLGTEDEDTIVQSFIDEVHGGVLSEYLEQCVYYHVEDGCLYTDFSLEGLAVMNYTCDSNDLLSHIDSEINRFIEMRADQGFYSPLMMQVLCDSQMMFMVTKTRCIDTQFVDQLNADTIVICSKINSLCPVIYPVGETKVLYPVCENFEGDYWTTVFTENSMNFLGKMSNEDCVFSIFDSENVGEWTLSLLTNVKGKQTYYYSKLNPDGSFSVTLRRGTMVSKTPVSQKRKVMFSPKKTIKSEAEEGENYGTQTPPSTLYSRGGRNSISSPTSSPRRQNEPDDIIVTGFEDSDEEN